MTSENTCSSVPRIGGEEQRNIRLANDLPAIIPRYADIAGMLDGTLPDPPAPGILHRLDGNALFYRGQVNLLFGDPESGKTWVAMAAAVMELEDDGRVLILDLDHNGPESTLARLIALGADTATLRNPERFLFVEPEDHLHIAHIVDHMSTWRPTLVTIDSLGELLPLYGSSNSADDFTLMHTAVLKKVVKTGAAVILIDHMAKGADSRAFGPGGTGAKRRAIGGVSLRVKIKDAFTPGKGGSAYLSVNKDRHGGLRQHCPTGDREPLAGIFRLQQFADGVLQSTVLAPADGERNPEETAPSEDVAALNELDPPPTSVRDAKDRLGWGSNRASAAFKTWRASTTEGEVA